MFIIINPNIIYIIIIDLYSFRINEENIDWTPNIVYLYCNEIFEEFDYLEDCFEDDDCEPMDIDNYYSDQEYWFEGGD